MKLKVSPNRMELLRLKKREVIAKRGHSLLQDKLEKLLISAHKNIKELNTIFREYLEEIDYFLKDFIIFRAQASTETYRKREEEFGSLEIEIREERVFNLILSNFSFELKEKDYKIEDSLAIWDRLFLKRKAILEKLFKIIGLFRKLELISEELSKTRRRVNALEYILIPAISESISYIEQRLEELEREFISSLLRIKDIIRKNI